MNNSRLIIEGKNSNTRSRLIRAVKQGVTDLESYELKPQGVFGAEAKVICGAVTLKSSDLDIEFTVNFDDDMEANEAEISVYNLSQNTINQIKNKSEISIEAGYKGDTGVIFTGYVTKVKTTREGADKLTTIKCLDTIKEHTIEEITKSAGTLASDILYELLQKTHLRIDRFRARRDHKYEEEQKIDGDLMAAIKTYSQVCGVSTFIKNGGIICCYLKDVDGLIFDLSEDTGLIGTPEEFTEEISISDEAKEIVNGYECDMLLQHRVSAGSQVNLKSLDANGTYRVCSGQHIFNETEAVTHIKMY